MPKPYKYPESGCPDAMVEVMLDAAHAEPPQYSSQSKPKGRKPKGKAKATKKVAGKAGKGKKRKACSKAAKKNHADGDGQDWEVEEWTEEDWAKWENGEWQDNQEQVQHESSKSKPKVSKSKPTKKPAAKLEVLKVKKEQEKKREKQIRASKKAKKAQREREATTAMSETPEPPAEEPPRRYTGNPEEVEVMDGCEEPPTFPSLGEMELHANLTKDELMKLEYVAPPEWVRAGNVYSNAYSRTKACRATNEDVKSSSKIHSMLFQRHHLVHPQLFPSFLGKGKNCNKAQKKK